MIYNCFSKENIYEISKTNGNSQDMTNFVLTKTDGRKVNFVSFWDIVVSKVVESYLSKKKEDTYNIDVFNADFSIEQENNKSGRIEIEVKNSKDKQYIINLNQLFTYIDLCKMQDKKIFYLFLNINRKDLSLKYFKYAQHIEKEGNTIIFNKKSFDIDNFFEMVGRYTENQREHILASPFYSPFSVYKMLYCQQTKQNNASFYKKLRILPSKYRVLNNLQFPPHPICPFSNLLDNFIMGGLRHI